MDRAALDVAMALAIACGGYCPKDRRAEDGKIPERYPLQETSTRDYRERTELNVRSADGTLILNRGNSSSRGTALTIRLAAARGRPYLVINLDEQPVTDAARTWLKQENIGILNVAGPRESEAKGIYQQASAFLRKLFEEI